MKRVLILVMSMMVPVLAHSATYHVAKTGSDGNTCVQAQSSTTAKLTIRGGANCLSAGDTLVIHAGTYTEGLADNVPSGINVNQPTVIRAASGETVWIDGITPETPDYVRGFVMRLANKSYIDFIDLHWDGHNSYNGVVGVGTTGSGFDSGSHYIRFINNEITSGGSSQNTCFGFTYNGTQPGYINSDNVIRDSKIHHCRGTGGYQGNHCIYLTASRTLIENNEIYDCQGWGIHAYYPSGGVDSNVVRNNYIHDTGGPGIRFGSGNNNVAYNNLIKASSQGICITDGVGNAAYNNTIVNGTDRCIWILGAPYGNAVNSVVRNNLCWANSINTITNDGSGSIVANNLLSNPNFANATSGDFHLTPGSPAIDQGATMGAVLTDYDGNSRPQGPAYDIGAFEYGAATQPVASSPPSAPTNLHVVAQ
jgi:Right handed beta helix region